MRTAIATKFVAWEVPTLENLQDSKVYGLRTKLNNGEKLTKLMIEYNIGVSVETVYTIKKIDTDFFSEEND